MEIMSEAQACLIRCLRLSGMGMGQIIEILEMVWDEETTIEFLEELTQNPTLDHKTLYSIASKVFKKYKSKTEEYDILNG